MSRELALLLLIMVLPTVAVGYGIPPDSNYVWHVTKDGSDADDGHTYGTAKVTVQAAVNAAAGGDTIVIWPGDYAEAVDASGKALQFIGIDRHTSCITGVSGEKSLKLGNGSTVESMTVSSPATLNSYGLYALFKENIVVRNCDIYGYEDGLYINSCKNILTEGCLIEGDYDGVNSAGCERWVVRDTVFRSRGGHASAPYYRAVWGLSKSGVFDNCVFEVNASRGGNTIVYAFFRTGQDVLCTFNNCVFRMDVGVNVNGYVWGAYVANPNNFVVLNGCVLQTINNGTPSSGPYDLCNASTGTLFANGCSYETSYGTITISPPLVADLDADGDVDVEDFAIFAEKWLQSSIVDE